MLKSGLRLLFGIFTQLIAVIVSYEFIFRYAVFHGGINAINAIGAVHPLIWFILIVEFIIAFCLLAAGIEKETKLLSKFKKSFLDE